MLISGLCFVVYFLKLPGSTGTLWVCSVNEDRKQEETERQLK